jgi:hypothetical protein
MFLEPPSRWNRCPFTFCLAQTQTCANPVAHHTALQRVRSPTSEIALLRALRCVEQSAVASSSRRGRRCTLFTRETCTRAHPELVRADLEHDGARALVRVLFISTAYLHLQQSLLLCVGKIDFVHQLLPNSHAASIEGLAALTEDLFSFGLTGAAHNPFPLAHPLATATTATLQPRGWASMATSLSKRSRRASRPHRKPRRSIPVPARAPTSFVQFAPALHARALPHGVVCSPPSPPSPPRHPSGRLDRLSERGAGADD